jgi:hypothetical protein
MTRVTKTQIYLKFTPKILFPKFFKWIYDRKLLKVERQLADELLADFPNAEDIYCKVREGDDSVTVVAVGNIPSPWKKKLIKYKG